MTRILMLMLIALLFSSAVSLTISHQNHDLDLFGWVEDLLDGGDDNGEAKPTN